MKFIDEVQIEVYSGNGGNGAASFRREKFVPYGGPDGGNGGDGGDVVFVADDNLNTLVNFRGKKVYRAKDGEKGHGHQADGKTADDLIVKVPVGTIIRDVDRDLIIGDLAADGDTMIVANGGRGGLGNTFFKSSTNQAPRYAQEGEQGEHFNIHLELKLIADIALVGLPNAGKSTLISSISAARPKVADYPFTTLEPNLGVVKVDDEDSLVVADIPGLIEDAAEGKGLGIKFLKHIERTSALVHLVDCSMLLEPFEAMEDYATVRSELIRFRDDIKYKPEIVCLTKIDAMTEEEINKFVVEMESQLDKKVLPISSVSGLNLDVLKRIMLKTKYAKTNINSQESTSQEEAR
jgi:GTP-binding protein